MNFPIIIVNFKTYRKATGEKAVQLAKICEKVAKETGANIAIAVQEIDLYHVCKEVSIPVFSEHIDAINYGSHTGFILPESVKEAGAVGTLLNHSEHKLRIDEIEAAVKRAKEVGLETVICANTPAVGDAVSDFNPDSVAIEPPELIGGKISVSSAKPELISHSVEIIDCPVLVGAGIHTEEDVRIALKLGAKGVLLASGVTKAENPEEVLRNLVKGLD